MRVYARASDRLYPVPRTEAFFVTVRGTRLSDATVRGAFAKLRKQLSWTGHGGRPWPFSLLPPENATGNFVKVVRRVPVKIIIDSKFDPQHPLWPGLSVVPTVDVTRRPDQSCRKDRYLMDESRSSHKWLIAMTVLTGNIMSSLDISIVNVALPHMRGSLALPLKKLPGFPPDISWPMSSYYR